MPTTSGDAPERAPLDDPGPRFREPPRPRMLRSEAPSERKRNSVAILACVSRDRRVTLLHVAVAGLGALEVIRTIHQGWVRLAVREEPVLLALAVALPVASACASLLAIALGVRTGLRVRALVTDVLTLGSVFALALLLSVPFGQNARPMVGILFMGCLAARLAPSLLLILRGRERSGAAIFVLSLIFYGTVTVWAGAATSAQGDQPHYLLAADRQRK